LFPPSSRAEGEEEDRWEIGLVAGLYRPSLRTLNRILREPRLVILQDPNHQLQPNPLFTPEVRNLTVPSFEAERTVGLELRRRFKTDHALVFTLSGWNGQTQMGDIAPQITTATFTDFQNVPRESRYDLLITQLWLGWRYNLYAPSERGKIFVDLGLVGVALAQLTVDTLLRVTGPDIPAGFPVVSSLEGEGTGFTTRWGIGGEYEIKKRLAISFRIGYILGRITEIKVRRFFRSGFSSPPEPEAGSDLQPTPVVGERVTFADVERGADPTQESRTNVTPLILDLDGMEALIGIHFYF
jgi:hypothetical protein